MPLLEQNQTDQTTGGLLQHVHIIDPDIGVWQGRYILKDAKVIVGNETADSDKITAPHIKLMEQSPWLQEQKAAFNALISEAKAAVTFYSEPFPIRGLRMVPHSVINELLYELIGKTVGGAPVYDSSRYVSRWTDHYAQSVAYRLNVLADSFCDNWGRVINEIRDNVSDVIWRRIHTRIPEADKVRKLYYLRLVRVRLAAADENDEVRASRGALSVGDVAKYADYIDQAARAQIDAAVAQATVGPREAFAKALTGLNELIQRDGRITDSSFNAVRAAISKLRAFSFIASPELLEQAAALESRISGINVARFDRYTAIASGFAQSLEEITNNAQNDVKIEEDIRRFGRAHRALDLS